MLEPFAPLSQNSTLHADARTWLTWGATVFFVLSILLVYATEEGASKDVRYSILALYVFANACNSIAAYHLIASLWHVLWCRSQRIFLFVCAAPILLFTILSTLDFLGYARIVYLRGLLPPVEILAGPGNDFAIVIWWILLPLQVLVWLALAIFVQLTRRYARRRGRTLADLGRVQQALYGFFLLAICAVGLMFYVMGKVVTISF